MNRLTPPFAFVTALILGCGSGSEQPAFSELHPVKGVVLRGNAPVNSGSVRFTAEPDQPEFLINSPVGADGTFTLTTVRTTDKSGERKSGAPLGTYHVTYMPAGGDQTAGGAMEPIELPKTVTIEARENDLKLELPKQR